MSGAILERTAERFREVLAERSLADRGIATGNPFSVFCEPGHRSVAQHFSRPPLGRFDEFIQHKACPDIPQPSLPWRGCLEEVEQPRPHQVCV